MKEVEIKRNYGIDLLKIMCMFFIVNWHVIGHGGIIVNSAPLSGNNIVLVLLRTICVCAVDCYAMITGYVYINTRWKLKNIINLYIQVLFYSIVISLIALLLHLDIITFKEIIKSLFPVLFMRYWYFTAYFVLFLFIPFINEFINNISKDKLKKLIVINFIVFSILDWIIPGDTLFVRTGYSCWWLIILYFIGAYIKKYDIRDGISKRIYFCSLFITFGLTLLLFSFNIGILDYLSGIFYSYLSPFVLLISISLIKIFKDLRFGVKGQKLIKCIVPYSFGVYIIHEHYVIRNLLIKDNFIFLLKLNSFALLFAVPLISLGIFTVCIIIDMFRAKIFKLFRVNKLAEFIEKVIRWLKIKILKCSDYLFN